MRDAVLAAGTVLAAASTLRLPGLPVGAGEILLVLWLALAAADIAATRRATPGPAFLRMAAFWIALAFALGFGAFLGILFDPVVEQLGMSHDTMAYVLMASICCLALAQADHAARMRHAAWFLTGFANLGLAFQLALGWHLVSAGGIDPWYWNRFRGWSENPNQLALYCAVFAAVAVHLGMTAGSRAARIAGWTGAVLPLVVGRLTKSDTFLLTMLGLFGLLALLRLRAWLADPVASGRRTAAVALLLIVPLGLASIMPYLWADRSDAGALALSLAKDQGGEATIRTANLRLDLWRSAVRKGLESASFGFGPGPHLDRPNIPGSSSLPRPFEAHSTILDLFLQGGIVAVGAFLWLNIGTMLLMFRARLDVLAALVGAILIFGISHFILRHPIVWFGLVLCLAEGCARLPAVATRRLAAPRAGLQRRRRPCAA